MPSQPPQRRAWVGGTGFFLLGAVSLITQTLLIREALFAFHGGEIGLGLFFAVWLGGIACGAACGLRRLRGDRLTEWRAVSNFGVGLAWMPVLASGQITVWRLHRLALDVGAGGYLPVAAYLLLLLVAATPAAFFTGWLFPVGLRGWGIDGGRAYALESVGSMAGGALVALVLLPWIPPMVALGMAAPAVLVWLLAAARWSVAWDRGGDSPAGGDDPARGGDPPAGGDDPARGGDPPAGGDGSASSEIPVPRRGRLYRPGARLLGLGTAGLVTVALCIGLLDRLDRWTASVRWRLLETGTQIVAADDTPYQRVTVAGLAGELSLYLDGRYQGSLCDPYVDSLKAAIVLTQHPSPGRVLLLSPGYFAAAPVVAGAQGCHVTLARADEGIDRIIERAMMRSGSPCEEWPPVARVRSDPREVVAARTGAFDLIGVLHGGAETGAGNRLYTEEFFADCARALSPGGTLVIDLPGSANVDAPETRIVRDAVYRALRRHFADVRLAPGMTYHFFAAGVGERRPDGAAPSPLSWNPDTLAARRARRWPGRPWPARLFAQLYATERIWALERELSAGAARDVRANSDRRPIVFYQQLRRWDRLSDSGLGPWLASWYAAPWRWSLGGLAVLVALMWLARRRWGQGTVTLATTGATGMGASLLLLLLFQTQVGTLYLQVGLMSAVFMAGMGLGAHFGGRWLGSAAAPAPCRPAPAASHPSPALGRDVSRPGSRPALLLMAADLSWLLILLALVPLSAAISDLTPNTARVLLLVLSGAVGVCTGAVFALVNDLLRTQGSPLARAGGLADAADHAGAVGGALATGTLLVPLLGYGGTLALLAGLKAASACGALGSLRAARRPRC